MRFVNHEGVNEGIEHKEGLNEENKSFEKTIKLRADTTHVLVDVFNLLHVLVANSATMVAHEHVTVDKSDDMQVSTCVIMH